MLSSLASIKLSLLPVYSFVVCFAFVWGRILYPFSKCLMLKVFKISRLAFFPLNGTQLVLSKLFLFFFTIIKIYLTKKFSKNVHDPIFIVVKYGEAIHESNWFLWWTQPLFIRIPGLLTWRFYFLILPPLSIVLLLFATSTQSSITRYIQGSNPHNIPWTCLPPFNFSDNFLSIRSDQIRSVAQSCPTLCDPMNHSTPGLPVHHKLPELTQTHVHRVSDAIQPSHPLSSPSPPAPSPSQHQSLFQWVNSWHEVGKVLDFQL